MIYVKNKKIVDSAGKPTDPPVIDCENAPEIEFQLLDAAGEAVAPEAGVVYTFAGATSFYGKNVIFTADCTPEDGDETLVFKPNTYNSDYIANVTVDGQSIFIQIHKSGDGGGIVMWGKAIARPRIADPAQPPAPIAEYYTKTQTDGAIEAAISDLPAPITAHSGLSGRDAADSHPISAITGLQNRLESIESSTAVCPDQTVFVLSGGIPYRAAAVMSGGIMSATMSQYVHSGGSAVSAAILGGSQMITSGGRATGSIVAGGVMLVSAGGSATAPAIGTLGTVRLSGGICSGATMTDGWLFVSSGGSAINTNTTGGTLTISAGGSATGGTIAGSGALAMAGGSAAQMTLNNTATNTMAAGSILTSMTFQSGPVAMTSAACYNARVVGPNVHTSAGTIDYDTVVSSGTLWTQLGGSSVRTVISGGAQRVAGVATDTVVSSGGTLVVLSGGSALNVTSAAGATVVVSTGGTITYKP